jgi:hypothetical protein
VKRRVFCLLLAVGTATTSLAGSMKYYALEVRGGSRVLALDPPIRKGRVLLFHRYPDGTYSSLPAAEVERVVELEQEPAPETGELSPGQTVFVGPALSGPNFEAPAEGSPDAIVSYAPDYGYAYGYWGGGFFPHPRPPGPRPPRAPTNIGPNGFPIIAPPGTPGSVPLPIGPNGFPVIAPPPPR